MFSEDEYEFDDGDMFGSQDPDSSPVSEAEDGDAQSEEDLMNDTCVLNNNAELEIEDDLRRLVQDIRSTDAQTSSWLLSKEWDFRVEDQETEFRDDLRAASGIGRRKGRKIRRVGPVLSPEVNELIGDGNQAYVDNNLSEAIRKMQEVIRIEPRALSAWSVLAQCYEDLKEPQKALQLRIMAAHLRHDAEEWDRLARESRELGYNQQAFYCYRKGYSLDPSNVDALWDRAILAKECGDLRTARHALLAILKRYPHDIPVLNELRPILIDLSDLSLCATLFNSAFDHYQTILPQGPNPDSDIQTDEGALRFGLMEIFVLADLYNTMGEHEKAITIIRRGCRWLQGRADQTYWDICEDDREFDLEHTSRALSGTEGELPQGLFQIDINARHRLAVARIKMGDYIEGKKQANIVLSQDILEYAPLFVEIADAYYEREMFADARPIYELLGSDAETSSLYVLSQTASCLRMLGELKEAAEVYEHVKLADPSHNEAKLKLAEIYEILNEPRKALELVYEVIDSRRKRPVREGEQCEQLEGAVTASLFEESIPKPKGRSKSVKAQNRLTTVQLKELEQEKESDVLRGYRRLKELWPEMLGEGGKQADAEREWLLEAEKLTEAFRETRNLFLTSRNNPFRGMFPRSRASKQSRESEENRMASRLHLDLEHDSQARKAKGAKPVKVDVFRGVSFDDWLRIFMQVECKRSEFMSNTTIVAHGLLKYAFILARHDEYQVADEVLRHLLLSNAYQTRELQDTIRLALLTCAIATGRHAAVVEHCRKLIGAHQFNNELQRLLLASLASGLRPTDAFITSTLQKHLLREMRLGDTALKNKDLLKWNTISRRYVLISGVASKAGEVDDVAEDDEGDDGALDGHAAEETRATNQTEPFSTPTKNNPIPVAIYGQICLAAKSYQSAIFYLLHAYDYCPDDPLVCLCLAIASLGRAMQRQSDNRHHLITQAMAFLSRYRELRSPSGEGLDEVEYNFGRAFHQLGLYSYAVKHYERVLEWAEQRPADDCGVAREAAYNLSSIFVMTGAIPLAQALYRRWLSI